MRQAVYPGTFDPVTNGHLDIIERSAKLFDRLIVAVAQDNYKDPLFSTSERVNLLKLVTKHLDNVRVEPFGGMLVNYVVSKGAGVVVRGLRAVTDFEYEFQMALMNRKLDERIETVFFMTSNEYAFTSSSVIKQVASLGGMPEGLLPPLVAEALQRKFPVPAFANN